jgi:hypothetical protein
LQLLTEMVSNTAISALDPTVRTYAIFETRWPLLIMNTDKPNLSRSIHWLLLLMLLAVVQSAPVFAAPARIALVAL